MLSVWVKDMFMYVWCVCTGCIYVSYEQVTMLLRGNLISKLGVLIALLPLDCPRADKREAVPFKNRKINTQRVSL